jgi:hypothetical protein
MHREAGGVSRDIVRLDDSGVLLRYPDPTVRRAHHDERKAQPDDLERVAILRAERALILLQTIAEHADLNEHAVMRIEEALDDVYAALQIKRRQFGMYTV